MEVVQRAVTESAQHVRYALERGHEDGARYDLPVQHLGVHVLKVWQLQDPDGNIRPQTHRADVAGSLCMFERADVQAGDFVVHDSRADLCDLSLSDLQVVEVLPGGTQDLRGVTGCDVDVFARWRLPLVQQTLALSAD